MVRNVIAGGNRQPRDQCDDFINVSNADLSS